MSDARDNRANRNRTTGSAANLESHIGNAAFRANEAPTFTSPVRVTFHSVRGRLADIDGLSGKAVLDGIVEAGILTGDTAKQVTEVRHTQSKGSDEKTIVTIEVIR